MEKNKHFPECSNCTRSYEKWCSYFEAKQTCDYKQFMQGVRVPFIDAPGETSIASLRLPVSVKSLLCITEGLTLDHGKGLVMRQFEDSLVIFKPNASGEGRKPADTTVESASKAGAGSMSPPPPCSAPAICDDDILSLWYTVSPSPDQHKAMTYESGPYDVTCPTWELRRLVELAIEYAQNAGSHRQEEAGQ